MRHLKIIIAFIALGSGLLQLEAQNTGPLLTLISDSIQFSGQDTSVASEISITQSTLEWTQGTGEEAYTETFTVTSVTENWDNTTSQGTITYNLQIDDYQAVFTLTGNTEGITAQMVFYTSSTAQEEYIFTINGITYL